VQEAAPFLGNERYRLIDVLGQGGMATVYRAHDSVLDVTRAVKVLLPHYANNKKVRDRFIQEARTTARLHHPNIVTVHDVGSDGERVFIVMELVLGGSLRDRVVQHGPLPPRLACNAIIPVLRALHFAHGKGVIHRDVKPHNVMLTEESNPKVTDFGIARVSAAERNLTKTGAVMGTWSYMAPEQRVSARKVDGRSDVYASAATLYHLLTDAEPTDLYVTESHEFAFAGIPQQLVSVLQKATRYKMEQRFEDAASFADELQALLLSLPEDPPNTHVLAVEASERRESTSIESMPLKDPSDVSHPSMDRERSVDHTIDADSFSHDFGMGDRGDITGIDADYLSVLQDPRREAPNRTIIQSFEPQPAEQILASLSTVENERRPRRWWLVFLSVGLGLGFAALAGIGGWWVGGQQTSMPPVEPSSLAPEVLQPVSAPKVVVPTPTPELLVPTPTPEVLNPGPARVPGAPSPVVSPVKIQPAPAPQLVEAEGEPQPAELESPADVGPSGTLRLSVLGSGTIKLDGESVGASFSGPVRVGPHVAVFIAADGTEHSERVLVYMNRSSSMCWDFDSDGKCP
jgi:serine/threonine protein kinase